MDAWMERVGHYLFETAYPYYAVLLLFGIAVTIGILLLLAEYFAEAHSPQGPHR
jgi:hypothetical protein